MRTLLLFAGLWAAATSTMVAAGEPDVDHRPNIVFILADDKYVLGDGKPRECPEKPQVCADWTRSSRYGESRGIPWN